MSRRPPAQISECARLIRASISIVGTGLMSVSPPATTRVYSGASPYCLGKASRAPMRFLTRSPGGYPAMSKMTLLRPSSIPLPPDRRLALTRQTHVLFYAIRPCNGLDTIVSNGRKKTMFRLLLDTALKTVAYRWQVIQIVETLGPSPEPLHPHQRGHRVRRLAGPADQSDDRRRLLCCVGSGTGAVARQDLACLYPGFPLSCPSSRVRGSVSSSRHFARSMRISLTARSCTFRDKIYGTYRVSTAFAIGYSTTSDRSLETTPRPFSLPLAV